ncbi:hypothetical protein Scep_018072 [Stephania cephalantha]|uniref:Uncharacterized protein n=1 Tax=Stephania cephalantha TaxID=152367 RepID=A0AAP0NVH1_9MAGN
MWRTQDEYFGSTDYDWEGENTLFKRYSIFKNNVMFIHAANKRSKYGYEDVPANNEDALMKAVSHQPVSVAIEAGGLYFQESLVDPAGQTWTMELPLSGMERRAEDKALDREEFMGNRLGRWWIHKDEKDQRRGVMWDKQVGILPCPNSHLSMKQLTAFAVAANKVTLQALI